MLGGLPGGVCWLERDSIVQPAKLPNTHARKGTSVRQTDRVHVANVGPVSAVA